MAFKGVIRNLNEKIKEIEGHLKEINGPSRKLNEIQTFLSEIKGNDRKYRKCMGNLKNPYGTLGSPTFECFND